MKSGVVFSRFPLPVTLAPVAMAFVERLLLWMTPDHVPPSDASYQTPAVVGLLKMLFSITRPVVLPPMMMCPSFQGFASLNVLSTMTKPFIVAPPPLYRWIGQPRKQL